MNDLRLLSFYGSNSGLVPLSCKKAISRGSNPSRGCEGWCWSDCCGSCMRWAATCSVSAAHRLPLASSRSRRGNGPDRSTRLLIVQQSLSPDRRRPVQGSIALCLCVGLEPQACSARESWCWRPRSVLRTRRRRPQHAYRDRSCDGEGRSASGLPEPASDHPTVKLRRAPRRAPGLSRLRRSRGGVVCSGIGASWI